MKRLLSFLITFSHILGIWRISIIQPIQAKAVSNIMVGEYLTLGQCKGEPILWKCVDYDENDSLMISDKILTIRPFDATGTHTCSDGSLQDNPYNWRTNNGSELWET
jgi:hypothetical protein